MSRTIRNLALCGASLVVIACVTTAVLVTRASREASTPETQDPATSRAHNRGGTLLLQPEAARLSRRLGKRFGPSRRAVSVTSGKLTSQGRERPLVMTRRQVEIGEEVELQLAGAALRWRAEQGAGPSTHGDSEAVLVERLIYDSPDYFVLAQLRGASYYTVARNVRPDYAPDNYDGPLWTLVRVEEPRADTQNAELASRWRLFYINSLTGLIDKVAGEEKGQQIEANFSDWTEQSGEKFPTTITWTSKGEFLMTLKLTNLYCSAR